MESHTSSTGRQYRGLPNPSEHISTADGPSTPVIFACGGTGIAPFRAFGMSVRVYGSSSSAAAKMSKIILYFGCRDRRHLLYADEIEDMKDVVDLRLALSREPGTPKTYVQQKMLDDRVELFELLTRADKPASVYVCGSAKRIGAGAHDALIKILSSGGDKDSTAMTPEEAADWLADAEHMGQYHRDVWG